LEVQHIIYPRTLKGVRRVDVTEHAAEESKDGSKERQKQHEAVRVLKNIF
jgi:hypothetical protein